jgi:NAD+ synthase
MSAELNDFEAMGGAAARFDRDVLAIDCATAVRQIEEAIRGIVGRQLHRRGAVVAVSGGVDSAVCAGLAARALGPKRVLALLMPDRDTPPEATARARAFCESLGIEYELQDIDPILKALGCYCRRDEAIRKLLPEYGPGFRHKIAIADDLLGQDRVNYFNLIIKLPDGRCEKVRMPLEVYLQVVAATNMKQRTRKLLECYHAERLNYAVIGTPNRLEYELGFFVRGGDGLADLKPIAHLYKTQVYAVARFLEVPEEIRTQAPSTDTYSLPQTQEEFYFALPYGQMDLLLYAYSHTVAAEKAGRALGLSTEQVDRAYRDIVAKRRAAALLHQRAIVLENVE